MTLRAGVLLCALVVVSLSAAPELEAQCAMCRTALESSEQGRLMAQKFNSGIIFLLGAPFGVVMGVGIAMRRSRRRLRSL